MSTVERPVFIRRFEQVWARKRFNHISQAICWSVLALVAGFAALCSVDYYLEIEWTSRAMALATLAVACVLFGSVQTVAAVRRWNRGSTAVKIEESFPELGQTVRTAVQFGSRPKPVATEGIAGTLVDALEDHADEQTRPLRLDSIIPKARLWFAMLGVAVGVCALLFASSRDWEWRTATSRALLADQRYTTLEVEPGNVSVDEGADQRISFTVAGRMRETIRVLTREDDSDAWTELEVTEDDIVKSEPQLNEFAIMLPSIDKPLKYQVLAGEEQSDVFDVHVRYPLEIKKITATIAAPKYTALPDKTLYVGNLNAIAGSTIRLEIELDRAAESATLTLKDLGSRRQKLEEYTDKLPLEINGNVLTTSLTLNDHKIYSIDAVAADGMKLLENNYRIRIRQDQAPKVWFESPEEALEVHTLAEVLMRIRASDDFGLSKAGVAFEINNEESFELISEDFAVVAEALDGSKPMTPETRATLEKILPLEEIALTQKDSVTYYAFAEDNYPEKTHRTESDLRFVDIRPFKRAYRMVEPMPGMPGQQRDLASLDELIARQRFALNRTVRLRRRSEAKDEIDLNTVDRLISFETEIADYTQRLAKFIEGLGLDGSDLLFQAEESMLAAVDSLSIGKYDTGELQEKDALRYLIEGRDKVNISIRKNRNARTAQSLRRFDRTQTQKLRRPKSDEEEAEEIAQKIEELARRQEFVYETLTAVSTNQQSQTKRQQSQNMGAKGSNANQSQTPRQGSNGQNGATGASGQQGASGQNNKQDGDTPNEERPDAEGDDSQTDPASNNEGDPQASQPGDEGDMPETPEGDGGAGEKTDNPESPEGGGEDRENSEGSGQMTDEEIEERQQQIAVDAQEIARQLQDMAGATELARERMDEVAREADEVSEALGRGDNDEATEKALGTTRKLNEVARNVRGVLAPQATQRVAMARDIANRIGRSQRRLADKLENDEPRKTGSGKGGNGGQGSAPGELAEEATDLAESGKTLQDILESVEKGFDPSDQAAVSDIEAMLNDGKVQDAVNRMEGVPDMIASDDRADAKIASEDIADQMDITGQKLDRIHRNVVAPRVEQIRKLQQQAKGLADQLKTLETKRQISTWHARAEALTEELAKEGLAGAGRDEMQQAMKSGGQGVGNVNRNWGWGMGSTGYYSAPVPYLTSTKRVVEELERHMQELVLGDLMSSDDGAVPPEYERMVERYLEVLSAE